MTKTFSLLLLLISTIIYSQDTVSFRQLTNSTNCIWTKKGEIKPFTGVGCKKYISGKKRILAKFEYGIIQGKKIEFHRNGKIRFEGEYISGDLNGILVFYYKNGQKKSEEVYVNGKNNGPVKIYYKNGALHRILNYKDGREDGESIYYDRDGSILFKAYHSNGNRVKN
jgi:antitoxin component YwqK of YwqJK toxin-antitoxin module